MKKKYFIVFIVFFPLVAMANRGHIDICNQTYAPINVTMHYTLGHEDPTVEVGIGKCKTYHWLGSAHRRLGFCTVTAGFSSLYARFDTHDEGAYTVGSIKEVTPWNTVSIMGYDYSGSTKVFNGHETMTLTIKSLGFNPFGSFRKTCNAMIIDYTKDRLKANCLIPFDKLDTLVHGDKDVRYGFQLTGISVLEKGKLSGAIPHDVNIVNFGQFVNSNSNIQYFNTGTFPVGKGENLPKGSYLDSCSMAYFDSKNDVLYAACPERSKYQHGMYFGYEISVRWDRLNVVTKNHNVGPTLPYRVSALTLDTDHPCKDIANSHGTLVCTS